MAAAAWLTTSPFQNCLHSALPFTNHPYPNAHVRISGILLGNAMAEGAMKKI
jgi:hypothetical protein